MQASVGSFAALVLGLFACSGASAQSLVPVTRAGGTVSQPVAVGDFLYVPAGVGIDVWNIANPAHPAHVGRTAAGSETPGTIRDLAAAANHLYANWNGIPNGVSVYSLADPAHPSLVGEIDGAYAQKIATVGAYLYAAGNGIGVISYSLADPDQPVEAGAAAGVLLGDVAAFAATSDRGVVQARSGFGDVYAYDLDLSDPAHPQATPSSPLCGDQCIIDGDFVIGFSDGFAVFDTHDPGNPALVFNAFGAFPTRGALDGDTLWVLGGDIEAWDASAPAQPVLLGFAPFDTPSPVAATLTSKGPYAIDAAGNGTLVDASTPAAPEVLARIDVPGGGAINGAAIDGRYAYLADPAFGLRIVSSPSLDPVASLAISPTEAPGAIDVAVVNGIAYVVGWLSIHAIDVSDARHPVEIGSVASPSFMQHIVVDGDRAYLAGMNQAISFAIVDIADPAHMQMRGTLDIGINNPHDLIVRDHRAYTASEGTLAHRSGLRVIDASNADDPVEIAGDDTCGGFATAASLAFLDPVGAAIAVGCDDGSVHLLDVSDATAPAQIATFALADEFNGAVSLVASHRHLYVGNYYGVDDYDLDDRESPAFVARYPTAGPVSAERSTWNAFIALTFGAGTYSYSRNDVASGRAHSHHARPARPSFEP